MCINLHDTQFTICIEDYTLTSTTKTLKLCGDIALQQTNDWQIALKDTKLKL